MATLTNINIKSPTYKQFIQTLDRELLLTLYKLSHRWQDSRIPHKLLIDPNSQDIHIAPGEIPGFITISADPNIFNEDLLLKALFLYHITWGNSHLHLLIINPDDGQFIFVSQKNFKQFDDYGYSDESTQESKLYTVLS